MTRHTIFLREEHYPQYRQFPTEALLRVVRDLLDRDASRRDGSQEALAESNRVRELQRAGAFFRDVGG